MLGEVHEGSFGTHANGHAMARKILRVGYYWLTMESNYCLYVRKCHKYQTFTDNVNTLPLPLNVLVAPWPFSMWGIDVIGAIEPKAVNEHRFILVAINYFTKWVEAASYASITRSVCGGQVHQEGDNLPVWVAKEDYHIQWHQFE